ncbi:MAG: NAD(P)-dependent oxidoreductase [Planctomycetota bacterium]
MGSDGDRHTERLLERGFQVHIWNRTRDKADAFLSRGADWSDNPLADCDRVIVSLFSSDVVSQVLTPRLEGVRSGQIVIDTTTGDPEQSVVWERRLGELGAQYLDAPISGSSEQTRRGEATVIVGGNQTAFSACEDLWPVLGKHVFHVGASGSAAKVKLVSNLVLGLNRAALAEGLAFAERLELDPKSVLSVLQASAAYSRQMDTKGLKMIERDFVTQAKLSQHLKDVRLILQAAAGRGLALQLTDAHRQLLEQAEAMGLGELDNSAIVQAVRSQTQ